MRFLILGLFILSFQTFAGDISLVNDREGASYYSSGSDRRDISNATRLVDGPRIVFAFEDSLKTFEPNQLCSFTLNETLQKKLLEENPRFDELRGAILHLRSENQIDDAVARILLQAEETVSKRIRLPKRQEDLDLPNKKEVVEESLKIIGTFSRKLQSTCFDDAYKSLYGDILKYDKTLKDRHFEALFVEAYKEKVIDYETYLALEKARENEVHTFGLSLKAYYKKIQSLRTQFPLRDRDEKSDFITGRDGKLKMSYRQKLLEGYTDLQIMLMANVIKKLRTRLESPKAEILIYDRSNGVETIELEPMERFRLAIKLLRKENSLLALNTYFAGRTPSYMDLMSAAYEVGVIPASELAEVAGLEDIWNPKKTFWEKAGVWVRTFSSVATIAIPPPYGFIPALAVVVIEMTAGKKDDNTEDPTVLF